MRSVSEVVVTVARDAVAVLGKAALIGSAGSGATAAHA
jgi:hypothetical protein